jgi:DNA-binding response OmpR family regulator
MTNRGSRSSSRSRLSEEGFRVVTATGGEDALAKAEEIRPDIVLLDIVMPDLDGIEVMRQLREQRPVR